MTWKKWVVLYTMQLMCVLSVLRGGATKMIGWTSDHQWCRMTIDYTNPHKVVRNDMSCTDQPYFQYFEAILQNPPSPYYQQVAKAVVNLYNDLRTNIAEHTYIIQNRTFIEAYFPQLAVKLKKQQETSTILEEKLWELRIHPISFSIPAELIGEQVPPKKKSFCRVIPGNKTTYFDDEDAYYAELKESLFTVTYKKAGWDCMRHYEILAMGSLPLFLDISFLPNEKNRLSPMPTMLALHPIKLYEVINQFPHLQILAIRTPHPTGLFLIEKLEFDFESELFDKQLYTALTMATMQYNRNVFSSSAMAKYMLQTIQENVKDFGKVLGKDGNIRTVLYLSHWCFDRFGDYLIEMTLHGLKKVLGENTRVVISMPRRPAMLRNLMFFEKDAITEIKKYLYGGGVSYGMKLDTLSPNFNGWDPVDSDLQSIHGMVERHEFDLVIMASAHRHITYSAEEDPSFLPLWQKICEHYDRHEVVVIEGEDAGTSAQVLDTFAVCAAHIFSREGIRFP